jgi:AraC-like DNA-binding protein
MDHKPDATFYCKQFKSGKQNDNERKLFRIVLLEAEEMNSSWIYFIQPYSDLPQEIIKKPGVLIAFNFDFLQIQTEHKDILFNQPFLINEFQYYKIKLNKENTDYIRNLFFLTLSEYRRNDWRSPKSIVSLLNIIFLHCSRLLKKNSFKKEKHHYTNFLIVSKFKNLIYNHAKTERTVSFYANQLALTPNYLNIVLKSVTGKNASSHIFDFLMNESRYLLIHTKLSLKEVAFELGFSDQSYFTRFFKKQTGLNPLDWFNKNI